MSIPDGLEQAITSAVDRIAGLDPRYLLPALVLQALTVVFKSLAWRNVIAAAYPGAHVPRFAIGCSYAAGAGLNAYLPSRGGDAVKVALARLQVRGSTLPAIAGALSVMSLLDAIIGSAITLSMWRLGLLPSLSFPSLPAAPWVALAVLGTIVTALLVMRRMRPGAASRLLARVAQGFAVLRSPEFYVRRVVPFQLASWCCRIGVAALLLAAFGIHAGLETAALLVVLGGVSTAVPVPGGAGAPQLLATYALQGLVTAAGAVSFSVGMQVGITVVNTTIGIAGAMILFRTADPRAAIAAFRRLRPAPVGPGG